MSNPAPLPRIAYVRTISRPDWSPLRDYDDTRRIMSHCIRQPDNLETDTTIPRHRFHFTAFTKDDSQILDHLFDAFPPPPRINTYPTFLSGIKQSDIEIHTSLAHAHSPLGRKTLSRCQALGFTTKTHGTTNTDCDEDLLESSAYLLDLHHLTSQGLTWFLQHAQPGVRESNLLSDPDYDVRKLEVAPRPRFSVWSRNSGCFHGNYTWRCGGCGGKCKRGRCRVSPRPERMVPEELRLPRRGSVQWRELSAEEVCRRYWAQCDPERVGRYHCGVDDWGSVDTFSGD
ncbi:hypothetical protein N0V94_003481 [Neodidymelliopsis sp. IMI 364377]|nr:hypothetical protein N0V94_003481 [Neodidymelliopsis sp. IMI 364377]